MATSGVQLDLRRTSWHPNVGISRYARTLSRQIEEIAPPDLRVVPLTLKGAQPVANKNAISVGKHSGFLSRFFQEQIRMWSVSAQADLLHLPWHEGPLRPQCPFVVTVHDLATVGAGRGYRLRLRAYYNTLLRAHIRTARRVIVPSRTTLDRLNSHWPGRPYVHIPMGVDAIFFSDLPRPSRSTTPTILYTGGFDPRKRFSDLLEAFTLIAQRDCDVCLIVTGDVETRESAAVAIHPCRERINLVGRLSDRELAELYQHATVVAYPSELEGFGFPVLEAFASRTPVVACDTGSIPEIAGDAALLVPSRRPAELASALSAVLTDKTLRDRMGAQGRARAERFTWQQTAMATLDVYREALAC